MRSAREWLEFHLNMPFAKTGCGLAIVGEKGSGKTIAAKLISRELGNGRTVFLAGYEVGNLLNVRDIEKRYLAVVDEPNSAQIVALKSFITDRRVKIEPKGEDAFTVPFNLNFIITCGVNDITSDDRRFIAASPMEIFATLASLTKSVR